MQREFELFSYFIKSFTKLWYSFEICNTKYEKGNNESNNNPRYSKKIV